MHPEAGRPIFVLLFWTLVGLPCFAVEPTQCQALQSKQARAAAAKLAHKRDFKGVVSQLSSRVKACPLEVEDDYWVLSDLALALFRTGELLECRRLIAPVLFPGPVSEGLLDTDFEGSQVADTLEQTLGRCTEAQEKVRAPLRADACPFSVSPKPAAIIAVPPANAPVGAPLTCLLLTQPAKGEGCPQIVTVIADDHGLQNKRVIGVAGGTLADPLTDKGQCCNARTLRFGLLEGKRTVLVGGRGRECSGGAGVEELAALYEWTESDALILLRDESVQLR